MKTIVRDRYPVERLPQDIREEIHGVESVRVTVEMLEADQERPSLEQIFDQVRQMHRDGLIKPVTTEEAVARIRALRDEWDD